ncbi:MAG: FMN-binding negative transcriptional regulator [Ferrovum sp.]|nr:FMN-binding negative transcriptional regulator [Ferrovum sp.]
MYLPKAFRENRIEVMHGLMRSHPLAMLITGGEGGLNASPVPFLICPTEGEYGTLRAHVARANPHWPELQRVSECLVVFQGEQGYITPSWYATKQVTHKVVPTWNYATVHAWGKPHIVEDAVWLRRLLEDLTQAQESKRVQPWNMGEAPADFIDGQMKAIIGMEIPIGRIEGKWKMSQNRPAADQVGVVEGLRSANDAHRNAIMAETVAECSVTSGKGVPFTGSA